MKFALILLLSCALVAVVAQNAVTTQITTKELASGSIEVSIELVRFKDAAGLIRIFAPSEEATCDPNGPVNRQLDVRDNFGGPRDVPRSVVGPWSVTDTTYGTRIYTAVMSPTRLRQQFASLQLPRDSITIGAVTGGSVAGVAYACVYRHGNAGGAGAVEVIESATSEVIAKSSPTAPLVDVRSVILSPVLATTTDDGLAAYQISVETRAAHVSGSCVAGVQPHLSHEYTRLEGVSLDAGVETRDVKLCDSIALGIGECLECSQITKVVVPLETAAGKVRVALDILSKFAVEGMPETAAVDEFASLFFVHFIIPVSDLATAEEEQVEVNPEVPRTVTGEVRTEEEVIVRTPSGVRVVADVVSGDVLTTATTRHASRSVGEGSVDVITAAMFDGRFSCLKMSVAGNDDTESGRIFVDDATMTTCRRHFEDGDCVDETTVSLVHHGVLSGDLVKFASGRLTIGDGETELCFVPITGLSESTITVSWTAMSADAAVVASGKTTTTRDVDVDPRNPHKLSVARDMPPPHEDEEEEHHEEHHGEEEEHHEEDHHDKIHAGPDAMHMAEWCIEHEDCTGVFIFEAQVKCDEHTEYDHISERCISHGAKEVRHGARWAWIPLAFLLLCVILGIVACVGLYHEDHEAALHEY